MNKSESKYLNTARLMDTALLTLLEKKEFSFITVKEICEKAGVNRSTFYLHYENMNDLLAESIAYLNEQMSARFAQQETVDIKKLQECPMEELVLITPRYLLPYLQFVREHSYAFLAVANQPGVFSTKQISEMLHTRLFDPILDRYGVAPSDRKYMMTFFLNGVYAVILQWLRGGCKESNEQIAALLISCIRPS